LSKISIERYFGQNKTNTLTYNYLIQNNKIIEVNFTDIIDKTITHIKLSYSTKGNLKSYNWKDNINNYISEGENFYSYDSQNRLINTLRKTYIQNPNRDSSDGNYPIKYNDDNILVLRNNEIFITFNLDDNGIIYEKQSIQGKTSFYEKVIYNNEYDVVTHLEGKTSQHKTRYYYNKEILPKGVFINLWKNLLGLNKNNLILRNNSIIKLKHIGYLFPFQTATKFINKIDDQGRITEYEYIFDEENYPLEKKGILEGEVVSKTVYEYK
jgi:hypothetical protein